MGLNETPLPWAQGRGVAPYPGRGLPTPCGSRPCPSSPELAQFLLPLPFGPTSACPLRWAASPTAGWAYPLLPPCGPGLAPPCGRTHWPRPAWVPPHLRLPRTWEAALVPLGPRGMRSCHDLGGFSVPWGAPAPSVGREAWHLRGREGEDLGDRGRASQSLPESSGQGLPPGCTVSCQAWGGGEWEVGGLCKDLSSIWTWHIQQ